MDTLVTVNAVLAGFFACAAIHYAVHWWLSRHERVLLVFSVQCALYAVFCLAISAFFRATDDPRQPGHARQVRHARRDHPRRCSSSSMRTSAVAATVPSARSSRACWSSSPSWNQWVPLRGTVLELRTMPLPWGGTGLLPIRTPPGASLAIQYLFVLAIQVYGFFVARAIWKRDRAGAVLVAIGAAAILAGFALGFLVDFAKVRAPYPGALPHAINVLCVAFFLSREYSARGARVAATERQFEAAFEHGPIGKALLALDGRFLRVNRALCRVLGWTAAELGARRLRDVTHPDDLGSDEVEFQRLLDVPAYTVEKRLLRKDGEPVWALLALVGRPR